MTKIFTSWLMICTCFLAGCAALVVGISPTELETRVAHDLKKMREAAVGESMREILNLLYSPRKLSTLSLSQSMREILNLLPIPPEPFVTSDGQGRMVYVIQVNPNIRVDYAKIAPVGFGKSVYDITYMWFFYIGKNGLVYNVKLKVSETSAGF